MDAITVYESLCRPTTGAELERFASRLRTHLDAVEEAALADAEVDVNLAERLTDGLQTVLRIHAQLSAEQRARLRGAIDYFLLTADADNDLAPRGLIDDAQVFNQMCRELDRTDLVLRIE